MTRSCLYSGTIRHRRRGEHAREFCHSIALLYADLDELPRLLGGRLVRRRPGLVRVRRGDYLGPAGVPLADAVRDLVARRTPTRPAGRVAMLAHPRVLGRCFNPVVFYYCWHEDGRRLEAVVAEVTNTPWGERHAYVVPAESGRVVDGAFEKALHVSPFMGMDQRYVTRLTAPDETLSVHIESHAAGAAVFDATLHLHRRELTPRSLYATAGTLRVLPLIYAHALGLRLAGFRVHPHPVGDVR